jgi:hypothetical protein
MTAGARIRLPDDVLARWRVAAEASGLCLSDWLRDRIDGPGRDEPTGEPVKTGKPTPRRGSGRRRPFTPADPELVAQLARLGNNLNQIARWANEHKRAAEAVAVVAHLAAIEAQLEILLPTAHLQAPPRESHPDAHQVPAS